MRPYETWKDTPLLFTCLLSWGPVTTYTPAWKHYVWTLVCSPKHALLRLLNPEWQRTCVLFRTHAITFFHSDAIHWGGISQECQRWLFFPFAPIFCVGKNYSGPWQITIKSIRKEQEFQKQNIRWGVEAQRDAASQYNFDQGRSPWRWLYFLADPLCTAMQKWNDLRLDCWTLLSAKLPASTCSLGDHF